MIRLAYDKIGINTQNFTTKFKVYFSNSASITRTRDIQHLVLDLMRVQKGILLTFASLSIQVHLN